MSRNLVKLLIFAALLTAGVLYVLYGGSLAVVLPTLAVVGVYIFGHKRDKTGRRI